MFGITAAVTVTATDIVSAEVALAVAAVVIVAALAGVVDTVIKLLAKGQRPQQSRMQPP